MLDFNFQSELTELARVVKDAGAVLYAVGGLPRNALLGLVPSDTDICSKLEPEVITALFRERGIKVIEKAPLMGTVEIHINGHSFEHTTFRSDKYGEGGAHRPERVLFSDKLIEDACRRDFTCNALYAEILTGKLHDPTGGVKDIQKRRIRATSKDPISIMRDDGLRVMRLARFACELGFTPEKKTLAAAKACAAGLRDISYERKRDELTKILLSDIKYPEPELYGEPGGIYGTRLENPVLYGLKMLYSLGALEHVIPELLDGDGVPQRAAYHAYDVMFHNMNACAAAPASVVMRLAGLLHDIGKPAALRQNGFPFDAGGRDTKLEGLGKRKTPMLGHDAIGAEMAREALERLRYPKAVIDETVFLIENHMYDLEFKAKESKLRAKFSMFGYERSLALCAMREADVLGAGHCMVFSAYPWRQVLAKMKSEGAPFSLSELNCTGNDIMEWLSISPCKEVGEIKQRMLKHCAVFPADNKRERLYTLVRGFMRQ